MNRTSTEAVIIHAVLAGSSLGGSAANASGACSRNEPSSHFCRLRVLMSGSPPAELRLVGAAPAPLAQQIGHRAGRTHLADAPARQSTPANAKTQRTRRRSRAVT